jgi:LysM repeat protein
MVPMKGEAGSPVKMASLAPVQPRETRVAAPVHETTAATIRIYTVRNGDTLYGIAQRYRTTVDRLLGINKLATTSILQPGFKLRLP